MNLLITGLLACSSFTPEVSVEVVEVVEAVEVEAVEPAVESLSITAKPMPSLEGHSAHTLLFGPRGTRLASISMVEGPALRIWEVETQKQIEGIDIYPSGFGIGPRGKMLILGRKRVATLWDVDRRREVRSFGGHWDWVEQAAFQPDGERIATYDDSPALRIFDVESGRLLAQPGPIVQGQLVRDMVLSSNYLTWCATADDGVVRRWNIETEEPSSLKIPAQAGELDQTDDGRWLAATLTAGAAPGKNASGVQVRVWDTATDDFTDIQVVAHDIALSPDGKVLAASWDGRVSVIDVETGGVVETIPVPEGVADMDIGADHVLAVALFGAPEIRLWRLTYD